MDDMELPPIELMDGRAARLLRPGFVIGPLSELPG
jgi:hypothetical protein